MNIQGPQFSGISGNLNSSFPGLEKPRNFAILLNSPAILRDYTLVLKKLKHFVQNVT